MKRYSLLKRFLVGLTGRAELEARQLPGWKAPQMFFLTKCKKHGYYEGSLHGFSEYTTCPECVKERGDDFGMLFAEEKLSKSDAKPYSVRL